MKKEEHLLTLKNGTTHTSVSLNNAMHQEWMAKRKIKEEFPDLTEDEFYECYLQNIIYFYNNNFLKVIL